MKRRLCGSGGDFFSAVKAKGADVLITGEATFHTCMAAKAYDISLVLTGHYASERFAVEALAKLLSDKFSDLSVEPSVMDISPITYA
ncbi:Nif3-like dinuclear metal center hexameric protein [bacterium]|nr:Nif3-like dinuclear metal center hexameric protein [bacterium]